MRRLLYRVFLHRLERKYFPKNSSNCLASCFERRLNLRKKKVDARIAYYSDTNISYQE